MTYRKLGNTGIKLSAVGLGCMGMSQSYGKADEKESLATLALALDLGINFWDTADIYGGGSNEELLAKALLGKRDKVFLATKFGFRQGTGGKGIDWDSGTYIDASPSYIRSAVEASLQRLKVDTIDLYYAHRVDPDTPIEDTVGAMADLVKAGKVRYLGLSECSAATLKKAHAVHPIAAVQSEYSLLTRGAEAEILPLTRALGIAFVPFSPLSRGLVTNALDPASIGQDDFRKNIPRFNGGHLRNNQALAQRFAGLALVKGITASQLALAWVLAQGDHIVPIPGTKRRTYLAENAVAADLVLAREDLAAIDKILAAHPDTGARYAEREMKLTHK